MDSWRRLYAAYMQSPEWAAMRRRALAREPRCRACHREDELHVHHITYKRFTRELPEDLMVLCKTHHMQVHALADATGMSVTNATRQFMRSRDAGPIVRVPRKREPKPPRWPRKRRPKMADASASSSGVDALFVRKKPGTKSRAAAERRKNGL